MYKYLSPVLLTVLVILPSFSCAEQVSDFYRPGEVGYLNASKKRNGITETTKGNFSFGCAWDESLSIDEALELALCANPKLSQARVNIEIQKHKLSAAKSAYLPSLYLNSEALKDVAASNEKALWDSSLNLSWLLLDFGGRHGSVEENRSLLLSAVLAQDSETLSLVSDVSRDYFSVAAARGVIDSSLDNESAAKESFLAAQAKYIAGVGARADLLQAQTAHSEAILDRVRAQGNYQKAVAQLAYTLGVDQGSKIVIDKLDESVFSDDLSKSLDLLIQDAIAQHPSVLSARAQLEASKFHLQTAISEGKPSLSFVSSYSEKRYAQEYAKDFNSMEVGLKLSFPLFEGFRNSARISEAYESIQLQEALLRQAELNVTNAIWINYSDLKTENESINIAKSLVRSAEESSGVAKGRYRAGVGSIIELLNAQTALANANQQYVQSLARWRAARIRLAASVGILVRDNHMKSM
ncbi:TolC family protein [Pseudomonas sp. F01002]|uniref:TolC family protein n=1 Tax=Pseudomonas sp. F01002 TaxID=2555724 RepID=UPI001068F587|nr:TolC family protein [Pseudomonas sp. F01002]TFB32426.1 TolC family protein [Pseudomonas sp. F01002]